MSQKFYVTFGSMHVTDDGESLHDRYLVIEASSRLDAEQQIRQLRKNLWKSMWSEEEWLSSPFAAEEKTSDMRAITEEELSAPATKTSTAPDGYAVPRTFIVGYTVPDLRGVKDFLIATGNEEFYEGFVDAVAKHGGGPALCSLYAKICYRSLTVGRNANVKAVRDIESNIKGTLDMRHGAVFEHATINFVTINCSRVFTHELVRHRAGTAYSQTSGRYCTPESARLVIPPEFEKVTIRDPSTGKKVPLARVYKDKLDDVKALIANVREQLKIDDMPMSTRKQWTSALRRIMPSGADNEIGWSVNIRSLRHIIELRTSPHAEWEIRRVFTDVAREINSRWPLMLHGGKCVTDPATDLDEWTGLQV